MKFFTLCITFFLGLVLIQSRPGLIPYPNNITYGNESVVFNPCDVAYYIKYPYSSANRLPSYYFDALDFVLTKTFPGLQCDYLLGKNSMEKRVNCSENRSSYPLNVWIENVEEGEPALPTLETDESYYLNLVDGSWVLKAQNYFGFIRGIETFVELIDVNDGEYSINYLPVEISDAPGLKYRGVMIDTGRHYMQLETLRRVIDGMFYHKLNVFHWHLVEEESFPLVSESYPILSEAGAYSAKEVYTKEDVAEIIEYARYRGIRVIPEIDTPAHSLSWGFSDELSDIAMRCPIWALYNGQLNPILNKTYDVVKGVLNDVQNYFEDNVIHMGGDEVNFNCWEKNEEIAAFMQAHNLSSGIALQNYYKNRTRDFLGEDKWAMYWVNDANFDYREKDVLQFWASSSDYSLIQNYSNPVVLSPYDYLYLDLGVGNVFGDQSWAPFVPWKKIYSFNPYPEEIDRSRIWGAEVCLWAELNTDRTTDNHLWIRASAFAERMWNPVINDGNVDIVTRLYASEQRLLRRGIDAAPATSQYCSLNPHVCFPDG